MLRFESKPDKVFSDFLKDTLELVIDELAMDIDDIKKKCYTKGHGWAYGYFEPEIIGAFGGDSAGIGLIKRELQKLLKAHLDPDNIYMPTDYHFKLLDRILRANCDLYSDMSEDYAKKDLYRYKRKPIYEIDFEKISGHFFWDCDYDFGPELARKLQSNTVVKDEIDISTSALNASMYKEPDSIDLQLLKWPMDEQEYKKWSKKEDMDWVWLDSNEEDF